VSSRALSFGAIAEAYERFRPGYPAELVDLVLTYAGRPVRTALEIGAGTGKATRLFAERGVAVTATEPDAAMIAELRRHVPADVKAVQAAFEDVPTADRYDLVYAAAAPFFISRAAAPSARESGATHTAHPDDMLTTCRRETSSGGRPVSFMVHWPAGS